MTEVIRSDTEHSSITHKDPHLGNVMLARDIFSLNPEHALERKLKVIDFGLASEEYIGEGEEQQKICSWSPQ
ncbi:hypothetical protein CHU98_g8606 [Xylaria longipes]|nr:hypothetical protein CHU98_g8606 [Xylaria longipes]